MGVGINGGLKDVEKSWNCYCGVGYKDDREVRISTLRLESMCLQ